MPQISKEQLLMQQEFDLYLSDAYTRIELEGIVNSTNKDFYLPEDYYPIYPGEMRITPTIDDIVVETKSGSTYTGATVASLLTTTDEYGNEVFAGVHLSTAPTTGVTVYATGRAQFSPVVCQSIDMPAKQKQEAVEGVGTTDVIYGYGAITNSLKADIVTSKNTIKMSKRIFFDPDTVGDAVETGFDSNEMVRTPKLLDGFMSVTDPQDSSVIIGFYKFEQCMIAPDTPGIKQGKAGTLKLDGTIAAKPRLLTPSVEGSSLERTMVTMTPKTGSASSAITNLTAVLEDGSGNLLNGKTITFLVAGQTAGTAVTNSSGIATLATFTPSPTLSAGSYILLAEFAGDTSYAQSNGQSVVVLS